MQDATEADMKIGKLKAALKRAENQAKLAKKVEQMRESQNILD